MGPESQREHAWLQALVGDWTFESGWHVVMTAEYRRAGLAAARVDVSGN
jgi:hypothetical protein